MARPPIRRHRPPGTWAAFVVAILAVTAGPWPGADASPAGAGRPPATAPAPALSPPARTAGQGITVAVPAGVLVFTQHCGAYGASPAVPPSPGYPGYPRALPAVPASRSTASTSGAPQPEPCAAELGSPDLVRGGRLDGATIADGHLSQVTVLDTRAGDVGWTLSGSVTDLRSTTGRTLDADRLGWAPSVARPVSTPAYRHLVHAGPRVLPGQGLDGDTNGLTQPSVLAWAPAGAGLGLAAVDARLQLVVPPGHDPGPYTAVITLTVL